MTPNFKCLLCASARLEEFEEFRALPRVTSDCKPFPAGGRLNVCGNCGSVQKLPDAAWSVEIGRIYEAYEIYQLSDGAEQLIFTGSGAAPRSQRLVEALQKITTLPASGRLIDIGCGNGAALARYSKALPGWKLYGSELSDKALPRLRRVPNFVELFTGPIDEITGDFDLVSMIHSLEHMPSPRSTLDQAKRLLAADGLLFVEVPDVETSPFDLLVADHLLHFSRATLRYLAARAGIAAEFLSNNVLPKEITMMGRKGSEDVSPPSAAVGMQIARATVSWLAQVLTLARALAAAQPFGIFGTSISGMWIYGPLSDQVSFFVDEDPTRIGQNFEGKPILSPLDAPPGATVFIPMAPAVSRKVAERYAGRTARFIATPEFTDEPMA